MPGSSRSPYSIYTRYLCLHELNLHVSRWYAHKLLLLTLLIGFDTSGAYQLPTLYAPKTVGISKGYLPIPTPVTDQGPQFDIFSMLSYKFVNPKNNDKLSIRFGEFDAKFPVTLQVVFLDRVEPNVRIMSDFTYL
jgi:hypothetical protein